MDGLYTLGADGGSVRAENIWISLWIVANWASPSVRNGELGWGFAMVAACLVAARWESLAGEDTGTAQRCGKNLTVMLFHSARVEGM